VPRPFFRARLSEPLGHTESLAEWFEVYGKSWRTFGRYLWGFGVMDDPEVRSMLLDRRWHAELHSRQSVCHAYQGQDYHYCTPEHRCFGWLERERNGTLVGKAAIGWSGWYLNGRKRAQPVRRRRDRPFGWVRWVWRLLRYG
jgi:hypothetical protein